MKLSHRFNLILTVILSLNIALFGQSEGITIKTEKTYSIWPVRFMPFIKRKNLIGTSYYHYDISGRLVSKVVENEGWLVDHSLIDSSMIITKMLIKQEGKFATYNYFYDEHDKLDWAEVWQQSHNSPEKSMVYKEEFIYDSSGQLIEKKRLLPDGTPYNSCIYFPYSYYSRFKGLADFVTQHLKENKPLNYIINDSLGRPLEELYLRSDGSIGGLTRHVYINEYYSGTEIRYTYYGDPEDLRNLFENTEYHYDSECSKLFSSLNYHPRSTFFNRDQYIYNKDNQLVKIEHYGNEKLEGYTLIE